VSDPTARGIKVIHEGPGAPIEIAMWWMDGRRESVWTSDKALMVFMADLATALRNNYIEPRPADLGNNIGESK
jgi:hypothetical protein